MAAFKKSFLVLAIALLALAGAGGTAYAQFHPQGLITCTANAAPSAVRAEGVAEILGDIVLVCTTSTTGLPPAVLTNFQVSLNARVTNNIDFGPGSTVTDAVLVANEHTADNDSNCAGSPTTAPAITLGNPINGQCPQYGVRTGPFSIVWNGVNVPTPPVGGFSTLRFTNIRANVCSLGIPSGDAGAFPSTQVTAFVSATGTTNLTVTNNVLNVGAPLLGLVSATRAIASDGSTSSLTTISAQQCVPLVLASDGSLPSAVSSALASVTSDLTVAGAALFGMRLSEGFATAFKTLGAPTDFPGLTQVEDGFRTPGSGLNNGGANQGTRFILRFFNVPSGVRVFTPLAQHGSISNIGGAAHRLSIAKIPGTDSNGAGAAVGTSAREVTITNGFGFVVYEVVDDNPFAIENLTVPIVVGFVPDTPNDSPKVGTMQMSASFAPISTTNDSSSSAPEPRFCDTGSPKSVFTVVRCLTNLLFPFVTNQVGFDTGFAISNTSSDDKGTTAQSGSCTIFYFGATTGGGVAPPPQTTPVIAAGKTYTFLLSSGDGAAVAGAPGFQGYIFVNCQFQFAHGFAFIQNGFGGIPTIAEGYLALVVPWNGVAGSRCPGQLGFLCGQGEGLGH